MTIFGWWKSRFWMRVLFLGNPPEDITRGCHPMTILYVYMPIYTYTTVSHDSPNDNYIPLTFQNPMRYKVRHPSYVCIYTYIYMYVGFKNPWRKLNAIAISSINPKVHENVTFVSTQLSSISSKSEWNLHFSWSKITMCPSFSQGEILRVSWWNHQIFLGFSYGFWGAKEKLQQWTSRWSRWGLVWSCFDGLQLWKCGFHHEKMWKTIGMSLGNMWTHAGEWWFFSVFLW